MERIIQLISQVGGIDSIAPDQEIYQAGLSSVHALSLLLALEEEYGIAVPDQAFATATTPRAIAHLVEQLKFQQIP